MVVGSDLVRCDTLPPRLSEGRMTTRLAVRCSIQKQKSAHDPGLENFFFFPRIYYSTSRTFNSRLLFFSIYQTTNFGS